MYAHLWRCSYLKLAVITLTLLGCGSIATAQNAFFTTGTYILDATNPVANDALVGLDSTYNNVDSKGNPYNPTVNLVAGGSVGDILGVVNSSQVNVTGGSVGLFLEAYGSSELNVSGGSIGFGLIAGDSSHVTVSGGKFGRQTVSTNFVDKTTGSFTLIGYNLKATPLGGGFDLGYGTYNLSGTLQDGTDLSGDTLYVGMASRYTLQNVSVAVPEPGSVTLLVGMTVSGAGLFARKRRCRK